MMGREEDDSRPSTSASAASLDQETRSVLRMMSSANRDQLTVIRDSLAGNIRATASPKPPQPPPQLGRLASSNSRNALRLQTPGTLQHSSRSVGELSRPSSNSSSLAVANAIQAENARVRRLSEGGERPRSRSSSRPRTGNRIPLSPEDAAYMAPPSVLSAGNSTPTRRPRSLGNSTPLQKGIGSPCHAGDPAYPVRAAPMPGGTPGHPPSSSLLMPDEICERVGRMDRKKQQALLQVLNNLDADGGAPAECLPGRPAISGRPPTIGSPAVSDGGGICIRVLSSWGNARQCGLTHIDVLDAESKTQRVPPAALSLVGARGGSSSLLRLVEGHAASTQEKNMWLATTRIRAEGDSFEPFEVVLNWPPSLANPCGLRLWNFNCIDSLDKGVRGIEIWRCGRRVWAGEAPRGTGASDVEPLVILLEPVSPEGAAVAAQTGEAARATTDGPIWLDGHRGSTVGNSNQASGENDDEMRQSFMALECFRASQSRKFFGSQDPFGGNHGFVEGVGASNAAGLRAMQTAEFGAAAANLEHEFVPGQELAFEGLNIPVRDFDGHDAFDSMVPDDRNDTFMGSSLLVNAHGTLDSVVIPNIPRGRVLVFNCVSTWGDKSFVGLAGIEIFDGNGMPVVMKDPARQVSADPPSINVLPEYEHDPRTADKLFDQVNLTRDDLHVWLAPFWPGRPHTVTVDLERNTDLSMIRIWNYNKSRLHSSRGVRDLEILLDGTPVFVGEIRRAPGVLACPEEACEHILFTQDEAVLLAMEEHDWLPSHQDSGATSTSLTDNRPPTAGFGPGLNLGAPLQEDIAYLAPPPECGIDGRPLTRAQMDRNSISGTACESITLMIHSTWGDQFYVGLTALELLDGSLLPIPLTSDHLDAWPRDVNELEGVNGDPRTLEKLLDGVSCTDDDRHMWLTPFVKPQPSQDSSDAASWGNLLRINFGERKQTVAGFNLWNYNKNVEDSCRGVKEFSVYCDERFIATFLCRKAPGHVRFDFKQVVLLDQPPSRAAGPRSAGGASVQGGTPSSAPRLPSRPRERRTSTGRSDSRDGKRGASRDRQRSASFSRGGAADGSIAPVLQQYETPLHPCGFIFRLLFLSTWSDLHYIGLAGIELYDPAGRPLKPKRAVSNHGSVCNLPGMERDVRTEEAFLHGSPNVSGRMWLAPFCRQTPNSVELVFDEPACISCIKLWNYARTPARGVRDLEIYVDDILIYQGVMRQEQAGVAASAGEAVLFTDDKQIVERERTHVYLPSADELVAYFDESGQVQQNGRPLVPTGLPMERPMTAMHNFLP